jgi:hypothetical protein
MSAKGRMASITIPRPSAYTPITSSHDITALDAATGEVVGTVKAEGDGEDGQSD